MNPSNDPQASCAPDCACGSGIDRRGFILLAGAGTFAVLGSRMPAMAGPFKTADFEKLVPADKKLHPDWVKSLFERGAPTRYRGDELKYIGMPVGGLCAGQLYLGGDGKLWRWDIFNQHLGTGAEHYARPVNPDFPLDQGFALQITAAGKTEIRPLDRTGFADIRFSGQYPIGTVEYRDATCPVDVTLEAFSPFIPLNVDDSSLPATVLRFTVKNIAGHAVEATLSGWLENAVLLHNRARPGTRRSRILQHDGMTFLDCSTVSGALGDQPDYGTMGLALLGALAEHATAEGGKGGGFGAPATAEAAAPLAETLIGAIGRTLHLAAGQSATVDFILAWHFPNLEIDKLGKVGRHYAKRFDSAHAAARYIAGNFDRLTSQTRLWRDTWYDSTLPYWFLDRTFLNTSILATSTCYRFADGRFYAWEGVGCCPGTCTHVWHYAQAMARLFPELERDTRERVDLGLAFNPDSGIMGFRAEFDHGLAVDGQAGTLLRVYREHQMSGDDTFLQRCWPRIKKAFEPLLRLDGNDDGVLEGGQMNTLDQPWYGRITWLSALYVAALRAGEQMARETGDGDFAARCHAVADRGARNLSEQLFDGEYFINQVDPAHPDTINSGTGCEIDQVFGQSWAFQVHLGRVLPEKQTRSALESLWRYNFTPDAGAYRAVHKPGRWYALAGEAGLLMCTFPRADWDYQKASGKGPEWATGYFNECMTGFEYQVAGHMLWEGMVQEGLAITRAIHDRYHASRRNPWNEVECGDHYARAMAGYGVFTAACGYEYHGPEGYLGFAPRLTPENFKAAFTSAEGWGSFAQQVKGAKLQAQILLRWGQLRLKTLALALPGTCPGKTVKVTRDGHAVPAAHVAEKGRLTVTLASAAVLKAGQQLKVEIA